MKTPDHDSAAADEPREYSSSPCYLHELSPIDRVDSASRVIHASPATIYRAHIDPNALISWLPPNGMHGRVEQFEPRVGGTYRIVLTYEEPSPSARGKSTDHSDSVQGRFVELIPDRRIVQIVRFDSDDAAFAGEMTITWTFMPVMEGTRVEVRCENVPPGIRPEDHAVGLASSLANLAGFCE